MNNFKKQITDAKTNGQNEIAITVNNRKEFETLCTVAYEMNYGRKNCRCVPKELDNRNIPTDIIVDLSTTKKLQEMKKAFQL